MIPHPDYIFSVAQLFLKIGKKGPCVGPAVQGHPLDFSGSVPISVDEQGVHRE